jgi:OmcA/MtrC family decaheme c-type cytochrome
MDWYAVRVSCFTLALGTCVLALAACTGDTGPVGGSCTVDKNAATGAATITCEDGTTTVLVGGRPGGSCTVKTNTDGTKTITCDDGTTAVVTDGKNGTTGATGARGPTGSSGATGTPGADGSNGTNGVNGTNGTIGSNGTNGVNGRGARVVVEGLTVTLLGVTIPADLHPVVSVQIQDAKGAPLDRTGTYSAGVVDASFVLSYLSSTQGLVGEYVPYQTTQVAGAIVNSVAPALASATQPVAESAGTWTEVDNSQGTYTYRFAAALPSTYDQTKTHTVAAFATRTYQSVQYVSNPVFHFRPDGSPVTEKREIVVTATCNHCHDTLAVHGGTRREVSACITCHVSGMNDPESGNTLDMAQMIHKIHRGSSLPSVLAGTPYRIVGAGNTVNDFSTIAFPQPIENCTACHQGGADSARWKVDTSFSRAVCTSCHDDVVFVGPAPAGKRLHSGGKITTDGICYLCHAEGTGIAVPPMETDIVNVHRVPQQFDLRNASSGQFISAAPTISAKLISISNTGAAQYPVVTFSVSVNGAPYDILAVGQALDRLRFTFAGPTSDYVNSTQLTVQSSSGGATGVLAAGANPGEFTYTSANTLTELANAPTLATPPGPAIPLTGTWALGIEGRLKATTSAPDNTRISVTYPFHNTVLYFGVTDPTPVPRRATVAVASCNRCHNSLQAHGGTRNDPEYCVLCHNANRDSTNIPAPTAPATKLTTSLRLSHMVHRIHTGAAGVSEFQIGTSDFSQLRFPGDRRDCQMCHVPGQYDLPLPALLPSYQSQIDSTQTRVAGTDTYFGPTTAACTGCHDQHKTQVHALTMSIVSSGNPASIDESCAQCHAAGESYGIDLVHARPGM